MALLARPPLHARGRLGAGRWIFLLSPWHEVASVREDSGHGGGS